MATYILFGATIFSVIDDVLSTRKTLKINFTVKRVVNIRANTASASVGNYCNEVAQIDGSNCNRQVANAGNTCIAGERSMSRSDTWKTKPV